MTKKNNLKTLILLTNLYRIKYAVDEVIEKIEDMSKDEEESK